MKWLLHDWEPYAQRMGLRLLRGDILHIQKQLPKVRIDRQKAVMKEYVRIWLDKMGESDQNKGRYAANQFILHL